jgi:hypothetical protein
MTTLPQLFDFVYTNLNYYILCGLTVTSNTPLPDPPPTNPALLPFVTSSLCGTLQAEPISASPAISVGDGHVITFPEIMTYKITDYWPYIPPEPPPTPYFSIAIRQYIVEAGLKNRGVIRLYFAAINYPWAPGPVECRLSEDQSGVCYGSDGSTMITMTIGTPTLNAMK